MWWINRFGSVTGPYSEGQIRKLVQNHQLTRLHKVSRNKADWIRVDQSEFWSSPIGSTESTPMVPLEVLTARPPTSYDSPLTPQTEVPVTPKTNAVRRRSLIDVLATNFQLVAGIAAILFISLAVVICFCVMSSDKKKRSRSERTSLAEEVQEGSTVSDVTKDESQTGKGGGCSTGIEFENIKRKVVLIRTKEGSGTGFLVKMDGRNYLVTNEHVVRSADRPEACLVDGTRISLGAMAVAQDRDLVRYEVDYKGEYFNLADKVPNNGDKIWVFGNSRGDGVITSLKGEVTGVGSMFLKVDAEFVGGNSGSPIVNAEGDVLAVASFILRGDEGHDWTTKGTEFDEARRFAVRFSQVEWKKIDQMRFVLESRKINAMKVYWLLLREYLICDDVSEKEYAQLKLEQKDVDRRRFATEDYGFHEMLMEVSKAYAGQGKSWHRWQQLCRGRDAFIKELNADVESGAMSLANAQKMLADYDLENEVDVKWAKVKDRHREFIAKKKEALFMARSFLRDETWQNPCLQSGYNDDLSAGSVDWYLEAIQFFIDQNAQKLKDLNKALRNLEGGDDDEE